MGFVFSYLNYNFTDNNFNPDIEKMNIIDNLKIFWQIKKILSLIKEVKKETMGEKKTELIVTLVSQIMVLIGVILNFLPPTEAAKLVVILASVYTIGRSAVKFAKAIASLTPSKKDDEIVELLEKILTQTNPPTKK